MTSRFALAAWIALAAFAIAGCLLGNGYQVYLIGTVALTASVGIGLNVLLGLTGQISLGHVGFYALGAYASAILTSQTGLSFWVALPLAGVLAALIGVVLALPALRVTGPALAMVTIAFGIIVENVAIELKWLTGGSNGLMNIPTPAHFGYVFQTRDVALLAVGLVVALVFLYRRLDLGPWGRAMRAVRASEVASQSLGLNLIVVRITAFAISAAAAGLAGALFAPLGEFVTPSSFTFFHSILFLLAVIIGGAGTTAGPIVGAAVVVLLPQLGAGFAEYQLMFFGVILLAVLRLAPEGVVGATLRLLPSPVLEARARPDEARVVRFLARRAGMGNMVAKGLSRSFGGVRAVTDASLILKSGLVTSIIGPNGAGKSTVLDILSGFYRPATGTVELSGRSLTGEPSHVVARAGVARTFQTSQLFSGLSVFENVLVALKGDKLGSPFPVMASISDEERRLAEALLAFVGYEGVIDRPAADLAHADRRLVEIARSLATGPQVLLLDEPAAGLIAQDTQRLGALLRRIAGTGVAVALVEHDMPLVMSVSDHVVVLDAGRTITAGTPAEVQTNPEVIKAYLGGADFRAHPRSAPVPADAAPALATDGLHAGYGATQVLRDVSVAVRPGEMVAVLGANGAGKSTLMKSLSGLLRPVTGAIRFEGREIGTLPAHLVARSGVVLVPEGRQVFPELSVIDNMRLGGCTRPAAEVEDDIRHFLERFPRLAERQNQRAGLLSGGEQQMLALARGLIARPRIVLLDEPSLGLAPAVIAQLFVTLGELRDSGMTLLLVDQMTGMALALADRAYVMETGHVVRSGSGAEIAADASLAQAYLGEGHGDAA